VWWLRGFGALTLAPWAGSTLSIECHGRLRKRPYRQQSMPPRIDVRYGGDHRLDGLSRSCGSR
jgi:hypothetical protein